MKQKATHILILDPETLKDYLVEPITKEHSQSNNFKGTESECDRVGQEWVEKQRLIAWPGYSEPHYPNAPEGSIWDY
jgi:hypothetical protein